jgi:hypothetical protein
VPKALVRNPFEVAEGLKEFDAQAEIGGVPADLPCGALVRSRLGSKISTPSKPAAAIASSLSVSLPPRETVAIDFLI